MKATHWFYSQPGFHQPNECRCYCGKPWRECSTHEKCLRELRERAAQEKKP